MKNYENPIPNVIERWFLSDLIIPWIVKALEVIQGEEE
jgi:hypothetical protein